MKKSKLEKKLAKLQLRLEYAEDNINYIYGKVTTPVMSDVDEYENEDDECDCFDVQTPVLDVVEDGLACELCLNDFINNLVTQTNNQAYEIEDLREEIDRLRKNQPEVKVSE